MKEGRRAGGITAGPESEVLKGGTSWEEAAEQVRAASAAGGGFGYGMADGDVGGYKVGAASKGIIQVSLQSLMLLSSIVLDKTSLCVTVNKCKTCTAFITEGLPTSRDSFQVAVREKPIRQHLGRRAGGIQADHRLQKSQRRR